MKALLNLFAPLKPGEAPTAILPSPMELTSGELHQISLALSEWIRLNPGMNLAKAALFKVDSVRSAWHRTVKERS